MLAIEGFAEGGRKRILLRIADEHAGPGEGLQQKPVRAERKSQRPDYKPSGTPTKHRSEHTLIGRGRQRENWLRCFCRLLFEGEVDKR